jgi:hypothetical protein
MTTTVIQETVIPNLPSGKKVSTTEFLASLANWIREASGSGEFTRFARVRFTSTGIGIDNTEVSGVVRYAEGKLALERESAADYKGHTLRGEVDLYDSNNRWNFKSEDPVDDTPSFNIPIFPFDPSGVEKVKVRIRVGTGKVILESKTLKGTATQLACESGLLFGFEDASGGLTPFRPYLVICLNGGEQEIPK